MRIHLLIILITTFTEHKRLVGITESLCQHRHHHCNLTGGSIDTELYGGFRLVRIHKRKDNLVRHLIQNTRNAQHQQRQAVSKHPPQQLFVQHISEATQFGYHAKHNGRGAYKVEKESICYIIAFHPDIINQVQGYVQENKQQLERRKLNGTFLITQISERNTLNGIHCHYNHHHSHIPGMLSVLQPVGDRLEKQQPQSKECQRTDTHTE